MSIADRRYDKSSSLSSIKTSLTYNHRPETFQDAGIVVPLNAAGEVSTICPECSHTRRKSKDTCLSVNVTDGVWYCHHCQWTGGLWRREYSQRRPTRRASRKAATPQLAHRSAEDEAKAKAKAESARKYLIATWRQAQSITIDDPVGRYFMHRGIWQTSMPTVLRFHPALAYYYAKHEHRKPTYHPGLVAAIQEPGDLVISLHRVYLNPDGYKASVPSAKKFISPTTNVDGFAIATTMNGAACRLDPATDELVVTEGIETGLAVRLMMGKPTWCALSATGIEKLVVPSTVRTLLIAADHDSHGKGEEAAKALAQRLLREDRTKIVKIRKPQTPGTDWADSLGKA